MSRYKGLLLLVGLVVIVPWVVWNIAIGGTVRLARESKRMEREIAQLEGDRRERPAGGTVEVAGGAELASGNVIADIMGCDAGRRCSVVSYTPYVTQSEGTFEVHTAELTLSGGYADLLRLTERAERQAPSCRLVSAVFRSVKQRQRQPAQLRVTLILQQITEI
jgi:hypothetical protein